LDTGRCKSLKSGAVPALDRKKANTMANDRYARPASKKSNEGKFLAINPGSLPDNLRTLFDNWIAARRASFDHKTAFEAAFCAAKKISPHTTKFGYKNDGLAFLPNATEGSKGAADFDEV